MEQSEDLEEVSLPGGTTVVSAAQFEREFDALLAQVIETGGQVLITRHGRFIAVMRPVDDQALVNSAMARLLPEMPDRPEMRKVPE